MLQRPDNFRLNPYSPLANGLVFAGLGALPGTTHYHDSSLHGNDGTLTNMDPATDWTWVPELGRRGVSIKEQGDYVAAPSIQLGSGDFTVSVWALKRAEADLAPVIIS